MNDKITNKTTQELIADELNKNDGYLFNIEITDDWKHRMAKSMIAPLRCGGKDYKAYIASDGSQKVLTDGYQAK